MPMGRLADRRAALRRAGVIFLVSCSAMGLATGLPAWGERTRPAAPEVTPGTVTPVAPIVAAEQAIMTD